MSHRYILAIIPSLDTPLVPGIGGLCGLVSKDNLSVIHPVVYKDHLKRLGVKKIPALLVIDQHGRLVEKVEGDVDNIQLLLNRGGLGLPSTGSGEAFRPKCCTDEDDDDDVRIGFTQGDSSETLPLSQHAAIGKDSVIKATDMEQLVEQMRRERGY